MDGVAGSALAGGAKALRRLEEALAECITVGAARGAPASGELSHLSPRYLWPCTRMGVLAFVDQRHRGLPYMSMMPGGKWLSLTPCFQPTTTFGSGPRTYEEDGRHACIVTLAGTRSGVNAHPDQHASLWSASPGCQSALRDERREAFHILFSAPNSMDFCALVQADIHQIRARETDQYPRGATIQKAASQCRHEGRPLQGGRCALHGEQLAVCAYNLVAR